MGVAGLSEQRSYITESVVGRKFYYVKWVKNRSSRNFRPLQVAAGKYSTRFMACVARERVKLMYDEWLRRENVKIMDEELGLDFKIEAESTTMRVVKEIFAADAKKV